MAHREYDYIAWTDLETVGGDELIHQILEVGIVLTDFDGNIYGDYQQAVHLSTEGEHILHDRSDVSNTILEMHTHSGLLEDARKTSMTLPDVDEEVVAWLKTYNVEKKRVILAGSGVGHFDQRFIRRQMPLYAAFLHYANLDVGQNRRNFRFYGVPELVAPVLASYAEGEKKHRALADAYAHLEEAQSYKLLFQKVIKPALRDALSIPIHLDPTQEQVWDFVYAKSL